MKMRATYSEADAPLWITSYQRLLSICADTVSSGDADGRTYSTIANINELLGLAEVARKSYGAALSCFGKAAVAWTDLLRAAIDGRETDTSLIDRATGGFSIAAASGDESVISSLANIHGRLVPKPEAGQRERYGVTLRNLAVRDVDGALRSWQSIPDGANNRWELAAVAIATRDEGAFCAAMLSIEDWWKTRVRSERLQKYPDAVCDHYGFGWLRLAERAWGKRPDIVIGNIPQELFDARATSESR